MYAEKRKKRRHVWPWLLLLTLVIAVFFCQRNLSHALLNLAAAKASAIASTALRQAAEDALTDGMTEPLICVSRDEQGRIRLIEADARGMNLLSTRVTRLAQERLDALEGLQLGVPLGAMLGSTLLADQGPLIHSTVRQVGAVSAALETELCAAGINQTRYTVTLRLRCTLRLVLPIDSRTVSAEAAMVVAESIIVGEVPAAYLGTSPDPVLNLAP